MLLRCVTVVVLEGWRFAVKSILRARECDKAMMGLRKAMPGLESPGDLLERAKQLGIVSYDLMPREFTTRDVKGLRRLENA